MYHTRQVWPCHSAPPICSRPASKTNSPSPPSPHAWFIQSIQYTFGQNCFNKNPAIQMIWVLVAIFWNFGHPTRGPLQVVSSTCLSPLISVWLYVHSLRMHLLCKSIYLGSETRPWSSAKLSQGPVSVSEYRMPLIQAYWNLSCSIWTVAYYWPFWKWLRDTILNHLNQGILSWLVNEVHQSHDIFIVYCNVVTINTGSYLRLW